MLGRGKRFPPHLASLSSPSNTQKNLAEKISLEIQNRYTVERVAQTNLRYKHEWN